MPLILVVEQDLGVVSHLRRAFSEEEGWRVQHVWSVEEAVDRVGSEAPDLFVVSADVGGGERILGPYARRQGGPGTLALVAEGTGPGADPLGVAGWGADAVLSKPITEEGLREAVEGILEAGGKPAAATETGGDEPKLTSNDIFGDLVAEVEREAEQEAQKAPPPPPAPDAAPPRPPTAPRPSQPQAAPAAPRPARPARPSLTDEDIERRLERTLSGVLAGGVRGKVPKSPGVSKASKSASSARSARKPAKSADADLDALLSKTLSGIELPKRKKPAAPAPTPTASPGSAEAGASTASTGTAGAGGAPAATASPGAAVPPSPSSPSSPSNPPSAPSAPSVPVVRPAAEQPAAGTAPEESSPELDLDVDVELELELDVPELELPVAEASLVEEKPPLPSPGPPATDADAPVQVLGQAAPDQPPPVRSPFEAEAPNIPFRPKFADTFEEVAEPVGGMDLNEEAPVLGSPSSEPAAASAPPPADRATAGGGEGVVFGQYRLLERIGVGGMAEVWKARMTGVEGFQKIVAIKKILPHLTDSADFVEMFIDEAKLAAQLNHANIIHIYDLGKIDGDYYIAMEYVEGQNLRAILNSARDQGRPLPVGLALYIAAKLASALGHAHRKRDFEDRSLDLVHRDVSPQNVLVGYEGTIKLCDFGIVKAVSKSSHTRMGALKGKLQYMSPEQAWGRHVDARSDIFAVGILLFEMLTGRRLFRGESELEVLEAVRECRVQAPGDIDPSVSREVDAIVLKALAKDPENRYQTAGELARRLEEALVGMRPSPGQPELADYMRELFGRGGGAAVEEGTGSAQPISAGGTTGGTASLTTPAIGPAEPGSAAREPSEPGAREEPPLEVAAPESVAPIAPVSTEPEPVRPGETVGATAPESRHVPAEKRPSVVETGPRRAADTPPATATPDGPARIYAGPAAEAVEPVAEVELEEGGRGGKGLLVGAILVALVVAALLYWFVWRPRLSGQGSQTPSKGEEVGQTQGSAPTASPFGPAPSSPGERVAVGESAPLGVVEGSDSGSADVVGEVEGDTAPTDPNVEVDVETGAQVGAEGGSEAISEAGSAGDSELSSLVERSLTDELAKKEDELRRQFEAKERELAERLAAAQRRAAEPEPGPKKVVDPPAPKAGKPREPVDRIEPIVSGPASEGRSGGGSNGVRAAGREAGGGEAASPGGPPAPAAASASGAAPVVPADRSAKDFSRAVPASRPSPEPKAAPSPKPLSPEPEDEPAAPPAPSVAVGDLVDMGPGVTPPQLVSISKPEYPPVARRFRVEGTVVVSVLVSEDGDVLDTRLDRGVSRKVGLNEAALEAARRAKYRPATKDGVRVKMWTTLKIPFRL